MQNKFGKDWICFVNSWCVIWSWVYNCHYVWLGVFSLITKCSRYDLFVIKASPYSLIQILSKIKTVKYIDIFPGVKLKQVEMEIHSYKGVGPCGSDGGVLTKLHHNSGKDTKQSSWFSRMNSLICFANKNIEN